MDFVIWLDSYNTGVHNVDEQHKKLVKLINELFETVQNRELENRTQIIFTELYNYTIYHFSNEERIMRENGCSNYEDHRQEHKFFTQKIGAFKQENLKGANVKITMDTINFLKDWLLNHINGTDKNTFAEIQNKMPKS